MRAPGGNSVNVGTFKTVGLGTLRPWIAAALKGIPVIAAGVALWELWNAIGVRPDGNGGLVYDAGENTTAQEAFCWKGGSQTQCSATAQAAAQFNMEQTFTPAGWTGEVELVSVNSETNQTWRMRRLTPSVGGYTQFAVGRTTVTTQACAGGVLPTRADGKCATGDYDPLTDFQADQLLAAKNATQLLPWVDAALDHLPLPLAAPVSTVEPIPEVQGPTTTTTGPTGTTTEETEWIGDSPTGEPDTIDWTEETTTTDPNGVETVETTEPEKKEDTDFCLNNPERVGCVEMGEPDDAEVPNTDINVAITPISFGAGNASCPADNPMVTSHGTFNFEYDGMCQVATGIRPVVIALAWVAAGFILLGFRGSED